MDDALDLEYERLLGEGSYGKVFLVKQQDGQRFAVKEIDLSKCDETGRAQALREATILARIKHDNILKYIESVINDDCLYIVTEYCGGGDLEDYLQMLVARQQTIPESLVTEWVLQLGGALKYLHDMKVLHRDMKTKNIFLTELLTVKLGDLGIAKVLDLNQSKADTFIGTPSYMSPELFTGKSYNHKTDIWGLGCCAYEMMTLKRAFQGKALWTLIREIKNGKVLELPDGYSLELRTLVNEMMSQSPADRPSAKDIVENDYLVYHRGMARDIVKELPKPNQQDTSKNSSNKNVSGSSSGSFGRMLKQKGKSEEEKFRQSISSVCEKLNTLNMSHGHGLNEGEEGEEEDYGEGMSTFVYKGDDGELEAEGTILNSELLQQYTEQLDTFVFKGFEDVAQEGTIKEEIKSPRGLATNQDTKEDGNGDDSTLLRQYSNTLEDTDTEEEEDDDVEEEDTDDEFLETIKPEQTSRYQYKGLKDTFQLMPSRKWRDVRSVREDMDTNAINSVTQEHKRPPVSGHNTRKHHPLEGKPLSASLTSTSSSSFSNDKDRDPRLLRTVSLDNNNKTKVSKVKTCDRILQTTQQKVQLDSLKQTKEAFVKEDASNLDAAEVVAHLRNSLTPLVPVPSDPTDLADSQGPEDKESPGKGKKKKTGYLKKEAQRKTSDSDQNRVEAASSADRKVTLFTRGQSASFTNDGDPGSHDPNEVNGHQSNGHLAEILRMLHEKKSEEMTNQHILFIQSELVSGVGMDNLQQVLRVMNMVQDDKEIQLHASHILGPKMYQEYKQHLHILQILEEQTQGTNS